MSNYSWTIPGAPSVTATPERDPKRHLFGKDLLHTDELQVGPDGDYITTEGVENLRQAILRRLIVRPGEYKFRPTYGVGIKTYVKKEMTVANLDELKRRIIENLGQDSRIEKVIEVNLQKTTFGTGTGLKVFVQILAGGREHRFEPFEFKESF